MSPLNKIIGSVKHEINLKAKHFLWALSPLPSMPTKSRRLFDLCEFDLGGVDCMSQLNKIIGSVEDGIKTMHFLWELRLSPFPSMPTK